MKPKILNFLLLITSLFVYLEWGGDNQSFLFQLELEVFKKGFKDISAIIHPFILLPLFGQMLLLINLLRKTPHRLLTYAGMACLGILVLFVSFIGVIELNWKILLSTAPFILVSVATLKSIRQKV